MTRNNLDDYLDSLNPQQRQIHDTIRGLVKSVYPQVLEVLFARQPYFYLPQYETIKFHHRPSIMMAFFHDHVNVFTLANRAHEEQLKEYEFTEKHTMQIKLDQHLDLVKLSSLFRDALDQPHQD